MDVLPDDPNRIPEYRSLLWAYIPVLLRRLGSEATVKDVVRLIFEHDEKTPASECIAVLIEFFHAGEDDLDFVLPVIEDAWNYFPHRSLGGRCPVEVMADLAQPRKTRRKTIKF